MVEITHAAPQDREEIAQFMADVFPRARWAIDRWRALLAGRWSHPDDNYAITVRDAGKLVGVLGLVTARRPTELGSAITANMTSWYLLKPYRGQRIGQGMINLAASDPQVTLTNFASARGAVPVVEKAGLSVLDRERLLWRPRARVPLRLPVHTDPLGSGLSISARDQRVLGDHVGLNLTPLVIDTPEGPIVVVLSIKQKTDDRVTYEVMYIGDRDLFARHARAIADSILPAGEVILSVDPRLLPEGVTPDAIEAFGVPRYYTAGRIAPKEIDFLYSETVLLDLKLY